MNQALMDKGVRHVVPVYTVEKLDEHVRLLVMKYMAGGDLAQRIRRHRMGMPVEEVVRIAREICQGLVVAHRDLDIVHRDIKPSNVLFDEEGTAYVADFGLALSLSTLSGTHHVVGTPLYMAPEQERGEIGKLTPAADVYALGCVLFEMLTGKRYKRYRPGTRVRDVRGDVPAWLDEVVARCLQEDPYERYEDAEELLAALEEKETQVKESPQWAAWYEAGKAALERGAWGKAVEALEALVAEAREYRDAAQLLARARAELERERAERARQAELAKAYSKGQEALEAGRWQEAIEVFEALLAEEPNYQDAAQLLARARAGLERERAERARQERLAALYREGKTALEQEKWAEAIEALEVLLREAPGYRDAQALLARAKQGQLERITPQNAARLQELGRLGLGRIRCVAHSPDGRWVAVGTNLGVEVRDAATLRLVRFLEGHTDDVRSVVFSPDGALLASGSADKTVRLWRVADGKLVRTLKRHRSGVNSVAFSPDGTLLASGAELQVRLWRVADGKLVRLLEGRTGNVLSVAFSPDGALVASGSDDSLPYRKFVL